MYSVDPGEQYGRSRIYGSQQTEVYEPLYSRVQEDGVSVTRWKLSEKERRLIFEGHDIFLFISTFGNPLQPLGFVVEGTQDG